MKEKKQMKVEFEVKDVYLQRNCQPKADKEEEVKEEDETRLQTYSQTIC